jgi:hypothetical protein
MSEESLFGKRKQLASPTVPFLAEELVPSWQTSHCTQNDVP